MKEDYISYENALVKTNLESLIERRETLCLRFAKACLKTDEVSSMFPLNDVDYNIETIGREQFRVIMAHTERLRRSAIPHMQRLLNANS